MKSHSFARQSEDSLIVVPCQLDFDYLGLALDTGASHTTIDLTFLLMAGYELKDSVRVEQLETASGVIDVHVFLVRELRSLGITKQEVEVRAYDFLAHNFFADFDGVLGLDFFTNVKFCVDLANSVITIQK